MIINRKAAEIYLKAFKEANKTPLVKSIKRLIKKSKTNKKIELKKIIIEDY